MIRPFRWLFGFGAVPVAALGLWALGYGLWPAPAASPAPVRAPTAQETRAVEGAAVAMRVLAATAAIAQDDGMPPADAPFGLRIAQIARHFLVRPAPGFRDDCSGFVSSVFTAAGVPMDGRVATIWDSAVDHDVLYWSPVPRVGDLVFFDDTHDRDEDGRLDDELTHIGVVIDVEPDGTAVFAHAGTSHGRTTGVINLNHPDQHRDETGKVINSYVRRYRDDDPPDTEYLAGELWTAFATVDPAGDWLDPAPTE